jgi:hypothetical protein
MAAPKRKADRDALFEAVSNRDGLICFMCGTAHARALTMIVDQIDYDDEDVTNPDNAIMACKTCVRSRDKRPIMAYMKRRLSAAKAEVAYLSDLKEDIRVKRILTVPIIMGDYAPSITTPNAVGITGSTVPARAPRFYDHTNMGYDDSGDDGRPLDAQHLDVFADEHARGEGGFKVYLVEEGEGAWKSMEWAVSKGLVPEGWETSDKLAIWPDTEADADYASRITTPNAVDGTGSTDEDVMQDLLDRYNDA